MQKETQILFVYSRVTVYLEVDNLKNNRGVLGRVLGRVLGTKYPEMTENDDPECFWVELNSKDIYGPRVQFGGL